MAPPVPAIVLMLLLSAAPTSGTTTATPMSGAQGSTSTTVPASSDAVSYRNGRFFFDTDQNEVRFDWIVSEVSVRWTGSTGISAQLRSRAAFNVVVDGGQPTLLVCNSSTERRLYTLASGLDAGKEHTVALILRTEAKVSNRTTPPIQTPSAFTAFVFSDPAGKALPPDPRPARKKLLVVGDSITAGWGDTGVCCGKPGCRSDPCSEDGTRSYGALVAQTLSMDVQIIASGGNGFGSSGRNPGNRTGVDWTEMPMDRQIFRRLQYDPAAGAANLSAFVPDFVVINIGTNDRPSASWNAIYLGVLRRLRSAWPAAYFLLGCAPFNHGFDSSIKAVIAGFADPANRTAFLDFGDFSKIERGCYSHPSLDGHKTMAGSVVAAIHAVASPVLRAPGPPPPALPFNYVTPVFKPYSSSFANSSADALRDPTTAIFSAERGGSWHIYASSMECRGALPHNCGGGYPARIRHFSTPGSLAAGPAANGGGVWSDEGLVLQPSYNTSGWDSSGTFTPGIVMVERGKGMHSFLGTHWWNGPSCGPQVPLVDRRSLLWTA